MGFKQHISRTWQMIEQQVNDVPFRPDYEVSKSSLLGLFSLECTNRSPVSWRLAEKVY
ncbi:TPA: hypothetical protein U1Z85_000214 [Streptococcus suis]|nr:hypothetical protein [Streptococcus suis]